MKKGLFAAVIVIGTITASAQKPAAAAPPDKTKVAPTTPAPPPESVGPTTTVKPEQVKELHDALEMLQLDQLAVQSAQSTVTQTDPVAKRALEILKNATESAPEVKKAQEQLNADRNALLAKIDKLRTDLKLGKNWDWNFDIGKFVQTSQPAAAPKPTPAPAKTDVIPALPPPPVKK
jgi:hypothetical protein